MKIKLFKKGNVIHSYYKSKIIISKGYKVFEIDLKNDLKTKIIGYIPITICKRILNKFRLTNRLFRMGVTHVIYLEKFNNYVAFSDRCIFLKEGNRNFKYVKKISKGSRPLYQGVCKDFNENVFYGEYWDNKNREPVFLYKSKDGGRTWNKRYEFGSAQKIRHIHSVSFDNFENKLWITTGDNDAECGIYFSKDEGKSINLIGSGDQSWRAVSLIFTKDYVYWGTDSPNIQNWIYRYNRFNGKREKIIKVNGAIYYSTKVGNFLVFSTAIERSSGEWDKKSHIWISYNGNRWRDIVCFQKDWLPNIFQYGTVNFGNCVFGNNKLFFNPIGLSGIDGNLCYIDLSNY